MEISESKAEEKRLWFWVSHLKNINMTKLNCLLEQITDPLELMNLKEREIDRMEGLSEREKKILKGCIEDKERILEDYDELWRQKIQFISFLDEKYPKKLAGLSDRPVGLFVKGKLPKNDMPNVAIVGARACSVYGRECAMSFARDLSKVGVQIISGMAHGVDCAAGYGALEGRGGSFAVLGGGVNICYPKENYELYEKLKSSGGIISESLPNEQGHTWDFPRRNRIISGMSDAVIVVEARQKSGSLITADFAAEQGRIVYAIPGRIDSALSKGCHELIRNGATLLQNPQELLEDLKMTVEAKLTEEFAHGTSPLTIREKDIYNVLDKEAKHIEDLLQKTGYPIGILSSVLLQLEIKGYVLQEPKSYYRITSLLPPE